MANSYFQCKQFTIHHDRCAMKVTTDGCLFGAWVARAAGSRQPAVGSRQTVQLLDVGTGTGLLSLMVAQAVDAEIEAIEIDASAAGQAKENVAASPWPERISVIQDDVLHWQTAKTYDVIFSNPPFYENELKSAKGKKNIAHHDEGLKLAGLLFFLKNHLADEGAFFLLLPTKREKELDVLLKSHDLFLQQKIYVQQTLKHQPFRLMIQGRRKKVDRVTEETIVIKNGQDEYSPEFVSLLKDYYLYL